MRREAKNRGVVWVDLVEKLQQLPAHEVANLYIPDGSLEHPFADSHFNGNAWIAELLHERLLEFLVVR